MKKREIKQKKWMATFMALMLLCSSSTSQAADLSGKIPDGMAVTRVEKIEKGKNNEGENTLSNEITWRLTYENNLAESLDPEDHLNLWVLDEYISEELKRSEDSSEVAEVVEEGILLEEESSMEEDSFDETEEILLETPEDSEKIAASIDTETASEREETEAEDETSSGNEGETEADLEEVSGSFEQLQDESEIQFQDEPMDASHDEFQKEDQEQSSGEFLNLSEENDQGGIEILSEAAMSHGSTDQETPSSPSPIMPRLAPQSDQPVSGHSPEEDQKLVLTRVFSYWKDDIWLTPLFRDEAHVSSGGMTSTVLSLHRLGNSSDGYPYLKNYIWAYCIEPNVSSDSWTVYQNTAKDAVQLMLKIEQEAPSVYHGMIRAIAYTEYKASMLSVHEAAAFRCACQTVVWQLLCGMVDGSSGQRILQEEAGYVVDQLYDNIQDGTISLYDNYRETNIASFTGAMVREKLEEIYAYLGEYETIPSFMARTDEETQEKTVTMIYADGQYQARVTDEEGVLDKFLGNQGTLADAMVQYEREGDQVVFTAKQIPAEALKLHKTTEPASRTPAYFVYGSYSGEERKQSLLGECHADAISAWIRFAPAKKQTGIIKISEDSACAEGIRNNPNYNLEGAVFGIFDENNELREEITITTDVSQVWNTNEKTGIHSALLEALKREGSQGEAMNTLAFGVSHEAYEVGELLTLRELRVPRGHQKAEDQQLKISEVDANNIWSVSDEPILDPLELHIYKKGPDEMKIASGFLNGAEFTICYYPEEAGSDAEKPVGDPLWTGIFVTVDGGQLLFYRDYCIQGLDSFVGTINPLTGDLIFPFGWIEIRESKAPEGFQIHPNSIWIRLGEDETKAEIPDEEMIRETSEGIDFLNDQKVWGIIQGIKTDGKEPLSGAQMMICQENGQPLTANGRGDEDFTSVVTTGEDGIFLWEGLAFGTYLIKEIKAPKGYELSREAQEGFLVELTPDGIEEDELKVTLPPIENQQENVSIRIVKALEINEEYSSLESVSWNSIRFMIDGKTEEGEIIQRIVTMEDWVIDDSEKGSGNTESDHSDTTFEIASDSKGSSGSDETSEPSSETLNQEVRILLAKDLPRGIYTVSEIWDEALSAYERPEPQTVDFLNEEVLSIEKEVRFENRFCRYDLQIMKRSVDTGENMEGSVFRLEVKDYKLDWENDQEDETEWREDEKGVYQWKLIDEKLCTDANQGVHFEGLLKGEYRLYETQSPYPYQLLIQNVPIQVPFPGSDLEERDIKLILQDRAILRPVESGGNGGDHSTSFWTGWILVSMAYVLQRKIKMIK